MTTKWFIKRGDSERGPFDESDLRNSLRANRISADALVRRESEADTWIPLREVLSLPSESTVRNRPERVDAPTESEGSQAALDNPYAPPPTSRESSGPARSATVPRVVGEELIAHETAALPRVCLKCGTRDRVEFEPYRLPATGGRWAAFGGAVVGQMVGSAMLGNRSLLAVDLGIIVTVSAGWIGWALNRRRSVMFDVPLCRPCNSRWLDGHRAWIRFIVAFHALMLAGFLSGLSQAGDLGLVLLAAIPVLAVVAFAMRLPRRFVATRGRVPDGVALVRVSDVALQEIARLREQDRAA